MLGTKVGTRPSLVKIDAVTSALVIPMKSARQERVVLEVVVVETVLVDVTIIEVMVLVLELEVDEIAEVPELESELGREDVVDLIVVVLEVVAELGVDRVVELDWPDVAL